MRWRDCRSSVRSVGLTRAAPCHSRARRRSSISVNICGGNGRACQHERRPSRKASAARCAANHRTKSIVIASGRGVRICETCVAGGCCSDRRGEGERCSVSSHADAPRRRTETPGATEQGDHPLARPGRRDGPVYRRSQFMGACNRSSARSISRRRGGLSSALASTRTSSLSRRSIRSAARPTCRSMFLR